MNFQKRFNQKYKNNPDIFGQRPMPLVEESIKYVSSGKALDLGVGSGRNTLFLLSKGFKVTGVDMSEEGINVLRNRLPKDTEIKLYVDNVVNFDTDEKFDLVCAIGLLHFLEETDVNRLIKNIKKFTKIGGINVIGAKMTQNYIGDLPHVFAHNELNNHYNNESWETLVYRELERPRGKIATIISKKLE